MLRSDFSLPESPMPPGLRNLGAYALCDEDRWTPVVCTGAPPVPPPPRSSVRPPRALRLDRALRAPGLDSSWASGMALARGDAAAGPPTPPCWPGAAEEAEPPGPPGLAGFWASRLAFCSSTLEGTEERQWT